ncbi:tRNA (adenosine(37)-N6)-threonylcarbamoyltransferase complex dimerization subunit type 1 TsaB [uncultured Roseobacter sp.]|uniref:tRNA (adenosine(37)-N6)-threonylcarbamoyltransferase complex dimerization subunit type 1 TsaB n=1 Tax=uncultured Roseobacter sp. TaxID=114847 RepID=UPI00260FC377|nr:tRNA (adenosine(37)-N6)-threonylcarbamoyltransferase complex dimerization subunit type 1 TsaB [uncultured Roseobacter sp.]
MSLPSPIILAFDTSAAFCAAAVLVGDQIVAQAEEHMAKGQAERLIGLCQELLQSAGLDFKNLSAVGVGIGPGNFTGIRISASAARGLALGLGIPAVGVSGFDALRLGTSGPCACAIAARRDQLYLEVFDGEIAQKPILVHADELPEFKGPLVGATGQAPRHQGAVSIARLTAERYQHTPPRPAPLYLRPADAAPARDAPPVILP